MTSLIAIAFALSTLLVANPAIAAEIWSTPFNGVRHLKRVTSGPPQSIHVLTIDLDAEGILLTSTSSSQRARTPSRFAKLVGAQIAINADFFSPAEKYRTSGMAAGQGAKWSDSKDLAKEGALVFARGEKPRVQYFPPRATLNFDPSWMWGVVSGRANVVHEGSYVASHETVCRGRNPRTAIGLSKNGRTLILAVVDGRRSSAVGMTCEELATLMINVGAWTAANEDGGGSSAMYLEGQGVVNTPSDGAERVVANHLAVFAKPSN